MGPGGGADNPDRGAGGYGPAAGPQILAQAELLGLFTGLIVAAAARVSDVPHLRRRGRAMSLPAGIRWDLLPPLSARTAGA